MKKNENFTFKFLQEILGPDVIITRQFYIKGPIIEDGKVVRKYILVDFELKLPSSGLQVLVEFNGQQHFKSIRKWGGKTALASQRIRDSWLKCYCLENGIKLISINGMKVRGKKIKNYLQKRLKMP